MLDFQIYLENMEDDPIPGGRAVFLIQCFVILLSAVCLSVCQSEAMDRLRCKKIAS